MSNEHEHHQHNHHGEQVDERAKNDHSCCHMDHSKMNHEHMNHEGHDMSGMDHSKMDHEHMNHEGHDMSGMDHSKMNHEHMNHEDHDMSRMDHSKMNHEHMNHEDHDMSGMDHSKMNHEHMNHMGHDMSGMDHSGHDMSGMGHMHHGNFKQKFWISLVLALPVFVLAPFMGIRLPFTFTFPGSEWIVLILSTILYFYGGQPFLSGAASELKQKKPAMMTLIAMGISVAYFYSVYAFVANLLNPSGMVMDFFWELASLIVIMLLGHWIEMNAVMNASDATKKIAALLPGSAHRVKADGTVEDVPLSEIALGETVLVRAGEKVPADGRVVSGESNVNEALVTGEAKAVHKAQDSEVIGGSINGDGTLEVEVTGTGESGFLAQIAKMVQEAQSKKSQAETMAGRVSGWLFYAAVLVGLIAFVVWVNLSGIDTGLERLVTVLVIACPHALGLAIPLVVARSTALGAENGLLVRDRQALERAGSIDMVLMDKTGTLTQGAFTVNAIDVLEGDEQTLLKRVAAVETGSSHPLAQALVKAAEGLEIPKADQLETLPGVGVKGVVDQHVVAVVSARYLEENGISYDEARFKTLAAEGNSVSYVLVDGVLNGVLAQGDVLRPEAKQLIEELKKRGIEPVMLTGDNREAAEAIARQLGGLTVKAELKPADKATIVQEYVDEGKHVMMVGDGVNDAPALAAATIGMAIGAGTDVAIESADVVLVKSNPNDIVNFLKLGTNTTRKMVENLWWGAGYNILAIPLAAGVLAGIGFVLNPAVGAAVMSLSTVIVAFNAMSLKLK